MHPAEDWAETFAHYLHILDTLQTAESFGLGIGPAKVSPSRAPPTPTHPPRRERHLCGAQAHWLELTYALNQINRSMGQPDLYPFVVAPRVMDKLALVDRLVRDHAQVDVSPGEPDPASAAHLSAAGSPAAAR